MAKKEQRDSAEKAKPGRQLSRYRGKRDFSITREPSGAKGKASPAAVSLPFVVQKHAATRLHYDFRLAWNGVLKSWAVTKGPSYYPGDKRLAVQVEDHPMDYKDFEGTIPKGQYGGGTVMVWDKGDWEPHGDVDRGLKEGHLKFTLRGTKLKGDWALVRMNGRAGGDAKKPNWLLIKEHDKFERMQDSPAIVDEAAKSVVTKRSLEQIAADEGGEAESSSGRSGSNRKNAPKRSASKKGSRKTRGLEANMSTRIDSAPHERFPDFISPQLAQATKEAPDGADWVHELKLDGYRIQIHIQTEKGRRKANDRRVKLYTRKSIDWSHRMPGIAADAGCLDVDDAILDGEVVALDKKGLASFADLQAAFQEGKQSELTYFAFDILHLNGRNLRGLPFLERKEILTELLRDHDANSAIQISEHLQGRGKKMYAEACRLGAEGIVSKLASAPYNPGRGSTWLKAKCVQEQELVIGGFTPRSNDLRGVGALLLGYYEGDKLRYAGRSGTGFTDRMQKSLRERLDALVRKTSAFATTPDGTQRDVRWVEPKLVGQFAFSNWTRDNLVRQSAFKGLREDKPAKEVIRETAISPPTKKAKGKTSLSKRSAKGGKMADVAITHPEKVLDESTGMTKQELADYYAAVSDHMLPYITDRPLSIVRCPEGNSKPCFFQKHVGFGVPKSVKSISIPNRERAGSEEYLTVDSAAGLLGLAQMGVLEIHSWGSRNDSLEKPDQIVIDLDPDEAIQWKTLAASAKELRELLKKMKLESFLKCTGGKGLHVVVPIRAENEWPVVKEFCHDLVRDMEQRKPELYVTKMTKAIRKNRIFLDYLRNDREATAIAPFSPRARTGATVALPLDWAELRTDAMPVFRVADFATWKKRLSRDRWTGFSKLRQPLLREFPRKGAKSI
jgi:bifunctional non-homologous end joining protein LigD